MLFVCAFPVGMGHTFFFLKIFAVQTVFVVGAGE